MNKTPIRVVFAKCDRAIYISHLDLLRTMQRAVKRAKLPVWYTEGFSPKIYLNFPLALSVGVESDYELMDMELIEEIPLEEVTSSLNNHLPSGIKAISCDYPIYHNKEIGFAEYTITFSSDIVDIIEKFVTQDTIEVEKHSKKKGMVTIDIKPHVNVLSIEGDSISLRLPAGNDLNINANIFTDAFIKFASENGACLKVLRTKRTKILCKNDDIFA